MVLSYKCPNCGGDLKFDPKTQKLTCEYCLSSFQKEEIEKEVHKHEKKTQTVFEEKKGTAGTVNMYTCPSCGAEIVTDETTAATTCYYCHNPVVFTKQLTEEFRPSQIIPFKKSREEAIATFEAWCKKKWFLPRDFTSPRQLDHITGIYIPYWLVDCDVEGRLYGSGQRVTSWKRGDYLYTKTDIYAISRVATMRFLRVPHDASSKADDTMMNSIAPFDYKDLTPFSYAYLSGFISERYDVDKQTVFPIVQSWVDNAVENELRRSVSGYSSTQFTRPSIFIDKAEYEYVLMPIWMLTYTYQGKVYVFAMNGQTGKTWGSVPVSQKRLNLFLVILFLVLVVILFIGLNWMS